MADTVDAALIHFDVWDLPDYLYSTLCKYVANQVSDRCVGIGIHTLERMYIKLSQFALRYNQSGKISTKIPAELEAQILRGAA